MRVCDHYDDSKPDPILRDDEERSLFDLAIYGLRIGLCYGLGDSNSARAEKVDRCWATIDMLAECLPQIHSPPAIDVSNVFVMFAPHAFEAKYHETCQSFDQNVTRLLKLLVKLGSDLQAGKFNDFGKDDIPLERLLLKNFWLDTLSWYVTSCDVNVQGLRLDFGPRACDANLEEWREEMSRKLAAIQRRERKRRAS